jgi:tRNA(fMet)-specific endonuclease VapC
LSISDIGISSITVAELEYGVYKSQQQEKNKNALMQFLLPLDITLVTNNIREFSRIPKLSLENWAE